MNLTLPNTYQTLPNLTLCFSSNTSLKTKQVNRSEHKYIRLLNFFRRMIQSECTGKSKISTNLKFYYNYEMSLMHKVHVK